MGVFGSKYLPNRDIPDLYGRVAIVTGGNAGIGLFTVKHLAQKGAKVYLAARSESKATGAIAQLESEGVPKDSVFWLKLDLSQPKGAQAAAKDFMSREKRLDILVNNAAMVSDKYGVTEDGIADCMATNHFGPFIFTTTLLPLLKATAKEPNSDVRIVNVSAGSHIMLPKDIRFRNIEDLNQKFEDSRMPGVARYSYTKLANILFTSELQRRLDRDSVPITVITLHPGVVWTGLAQSFIGEVPIVSSLALFVARFVTMSPDQGSWTSLFPATSPTIKANPSLYKGKYLAPYTQLAEPSAEAQSPELAAEMWETTERIASGLL